MSLETLGGFMNNSILTSVKMSIGIEPSYTCFDEQLATYINSVLCDLIQMGIGTQEGFTIDAFGTETWEDFIGVDKHYEQLQSYVALKVKKLFDPPSNSILMQAMDEQIKQMEWRMYIQKGNY